jgi:hypothetical protein
MLRMREAYRDQLVAAVAAAGVAALAGPAAAAAALVNVAVTAAGAAAGKLGPRNVAGMGFGQKWSKGRPTGVPAVQILVKKKMDPDKVHKDLLPPPDEMVGGQRIPYDVVEVGQLRPLQGAAPGDFVFPEQPALWGASIGLADDPFNETGTYGCFVYRRPGAGFPNGQNCILSNNHILAKFNRFPIGSTIVQPGNVDAGHGGVRPVARLVAYESLVLDDFQVFGAHYPNLMDAAIAHSSSTQIGTHFHDDRPFDPTPVPAQLGMTVMKEGRTTGFTQGVVDAIDQLVQDLPYTPEGPPYGSFHGQIFIRGAFGQPFSDVGDSGSLVCGLVAGVWRPVGLLMGGNGVISFANPIKEVLDEFGIEIIFA